MSDLAGTQAFLPQEIIRRKRDGAVLRAEEIEALIVGLTSGAVSGEQAAAFAMAVTLRGMEHGECAALTRAMTRSGTVLDWRPLDHDAVGSNRSNGIVIDVDEIEHDVIRRPVPAFRHHALALGGPVLDKHSTGGIGDNVSLMLAPILAACGAFVPMISGRGLGHTGGTLDKLDAIPGYRTQVSLDDLRACVRRAGCAIVGAGQDLAPADAKLYAIRDVTATVDSIPLIVASILSKKLAAGLDALVIDVKTGSGAFMTDIDQARALAQALVSVAAASGLRTTALITDMDQPLAEAAGNAVEVRHAIGYLTGAARDPRVEAVVTALGATLLVEGGLARNDDEARRLVATTLASGAAAERFAAMVRTLGGPADLIERPDRHLPRAPIARDIEAPAAGFVGAIEARAIGLAVVALGGGRTRPGTSIDPSVGFTGLAAIGTKVGPGGAPLGTVHARTESEADAATDTLRRAYRVAGDRPPRRDPVLERIGTTPS